MLHFAHARCPALIESFTAHWSGTAGNSNTLWEIADMVKVLEAWEEARDA